MVWLGNILNRIIFAFVAFTLLFKSSRQDVSFLRSNFKILICLFYLIALPQGAPRTGHAVGMAAPRVRPLVVVGLQVASGGRGHMFPPPLWIPVTPELSMLWIGTVHLVKVSR